MKTIRFKTAQALADFVNEILFRSSRNANPFEVEEQADGSFLLTFN